MQHKFSIDDQFRDRLGQSEMTPPPMVWENVAAELARQNRRKLLGFWMGGGLATVGILAAVWFFYAPNDAQKLTHQPQNLTEQKAIASSDLVNTATAFEKNQGENSDGFSAENGANNLGKHIAESEIPTIAEPVLTKKFSQKTAGRKPFFVEKKEAVLGNFGTQRTDNQSIESRNAPESFFSESSIISKKESEIDSKTAISMTDFDQLADREPNVLANKKSGKLPPVKKFKLKKRKPVCPSFADRGEVFFLDFYAAPGMAFRTMTERDSDTPGYLQRRETTEKSKLAWTAGARGVWLFDGKYLLRAGLHFTQIQERFNFYDPKDYTFTIDVNPGTGQRDTTFHYGEHFIERNNYLRFLDLPLTIGIEQGRGAFGWSLNGGVAANLLFLKNGKIVDATTNLPINRKPGLKVNAGMSLVANAQVFYQLDKKSRVFIEPNYQRILQPVSKKSQPVAEKYSFGSLSFGFTRLLK